MSSNYIYELTVKASMKLVGASEILRGFLTANGVKSEDIVEEIEKEVEVLKVYFQSKQKADSLKKKFRVLDFVDIKVKKILNKDWQAKWKEDFKPFQLTPKIKVIPAWLKEKKIYQRPSSLFIDTSLAFGTGMHPTTKYMSEFVEEYSRHLGSFLDIGTGTGILAILALKYKAQSIEAIDISSSAIKIAKENFIVNGFKTKGVHCSDLKDIKPNKKFDFIAANLITQDLIKFKRKIYSFLNKNGYLAVSGISIAHYALFRENFSDLPLRCIRIKKGKGWSAVLFKKLK